MNLEDGKISCHNPSHQSPPKNTFTHPNLGSTYLTTGWKSIHTPSEGWIRTPSIIKERICGYRLHKSSQQILHQSSASSGRRLAEEALPWFLQGLFRAKAQVSFVLKIPKKPVSKGMDFIVKESLRAVSFCLHCFGCLERFNILSSCFNLSVFIVLAEKIWFKEIPADLPFPTSFPFQTCLPETMDLKDAILTQQKCTRHCWKLTSEAESWPYNKGVYVLYPSNSRLMEKYHCKGSWYKKAYSVYITQCS